MHILIGLFIGLVFLACWLGGGWFSRIIVFLLFGMIVGFVLTISLDRPNPQPIGFLISFAIAWPVANAPIYYWRKRGYRV